MSDDALSEAVLRLAAVAEGLLVLLRDIKRLDTNDYNRWMAEVDEARRLAERVTVRR